MTRALRNIFLLVFVVVLTACGGGGGGGDSGGGNTGGGSSGTPAPADVSLAQLKGSWFGSFDTSGTMMAIQIDIDQSGNITDLKLNNASTNLTGTITKGAADEPRIFRFVLREASDPSKPFNQGALIVDPTAAYMFYVDEFNQMAVVQLATAAPSASYAQADVNGSWAGDAATTAAVSPSPTGTGFGKFTPAAGTATCQAAAPASSCSLKAGNATRTVPTLTLNDAANGRWTGNYTEDTGDRTTKVYVSADKKFAGASTCGTASDLTTCNFYSLTKQ